MFSDNRLKAIIVEDEQASQEYLTDLVENYFPEITLVATEDTVQSAIDAINRHHPDIVFLDVEIKMGTGFDVIANIADIGFEAIFTTAFNQFAIDAFECNAVAYLLKPLETAKTVKAIRRCVERADLQKSKEGIVNLLQHLKKPAWPQRLPVGTMNGIDFIDLEDIVSAEAEGNYTILKLRSGQRITMTKKIKELEALLPDTMFIRIHHSYLVNIQRIKKYHKGRGGYIVLDDGSSLPVSPAKKHEFLKHFDLKL